MPDHKNYFDDVFINKVSFDKVGNISKVCPTNYDEENKVNALKEICKREGFTPEECVFIGDHRNDIHIAEAAGFSIGFNPNSDTFAQIVDIIIKKKDLREILKHIP
jgi:phosphoserine phosphatase